MKRQKTKPAARNLPAASPDESLAKPTAADLTPAEVAAKAQQLRAVIYETITPLDIRHVITTLVGQAKNGNHRAQDIVLRLIESPAEPAPTPAPGNVVQVNVGDERPVRVVKNGDAEPEEYRG